MSLDSADMSALEDLVLRLAPEKQTRLERIVCAFISGQVPVSKAEADSVVRLAGNVLESIHEYEHSDDSGGDSCDKSISLICCYSCLEEAIESIYIEAGVQPILSKISATDMTRKISKYFSDRIK